MSQSSGDERPASGGVMRRLAAGARGSGVASAFQLVDALFSPSRTAAYVERQQARRRRVAVPAPGDPPSDVEDEVLDGPASDDPAALPADLLGPVVDGPADAPPGVPGTSGRPAWGSPDAVRPAAPDGTCAQDGTDEADPPSARGEHGRPPLA